VRQWEDMMDDGHHYETCLARQQDCDPDCIELDQGCRRQLPNLLGLARVYSGLKVLRVNKPAELRATLMQALAHDGPVLTDIWIDKAENVLPMVPPGQRLEAMIES
jgi:acetolactate synthase-1/2/3 large subunit